ncbi:MAG TPA: hypothetical protein ENG34_00855 [Candidatus Aenigmarchaeota archaeon]|nr:hypothetical protein [Candidatus Aenigmarchaeota archaeon]
MEVKKLLEELEKNLEDSKLGRYPEVIVEVANDTEKFRTRREIVEGTLEWCIKKIKKITEGSIMKFKCDYKHCPQEAIVKVTYLKNGKTIFVCLRHLERLLDDLKALKGGGDEASSHD